MLQRLRSTTYATAFAGFFLLAGCDKVGVPDLAAFITAVQQAVTTACGIAKIVVPTAETIANILAGGDPTVKTIEGMTDLIVASVCPHTPAGRMAAPKAPKLPPNVKIEIIQIPGQ